MRSLVDCVNTASSSLSVLCLLLAKKSRVLTPNGHSVIFVAAPVHAGSVGGAAANVSPATAQSIGHAVVVIVNGGSPESKIGDGSWPPAGVAPWKVSVEGSIAYCHASVASNSRSTASGCCAFCARTRWLREMSNA